MVSLVHELELGGLWRSKIVQWYLKTGLEGLPNDRSKGREKTSRRAATGGADPWLGPGRAGARPRPSSGTALAEPGGGPGRPARPSRSASFSFASFFFYRFSNWFESFYTERILD